MRKILTAFVTFLFILSSNHVNSQEIINTIDSIYGLNPTLYNGQINVNNLGNKVKGYPFLYENFSQGTVTIHDKRYSNIDINYDIYNQELLLKYTNPFGALQIIILSSAWINQFSILTDTFLFLDYPGLEKGIYQVIGNDSIKLFFSWRKNLKLSANGDQTYIFTKAEKKMYLYTNYDAFKFNNNRGFIKLFEDSKHTSIKKYLKTHKINVKKASNELMLDLIIYCNKL